MKNVALAVIAVFLWIGQPIHGDTGEELLRVPSPDGIHAVVGLEDGVFILRNGKPLQKIEERTSDFMEAQWSRDGRFLAFSWRQERLHSSGAWKLTGGRFAQVDYPKIDLYLQKDPGFDSDARWSESHFAIDGDRLLITVRALAPDNAPRIYDGDYDIYTVVLRPGKENYTLIRIIRTPPGKSSEARIVWDVKTANNAVDSTAPHAATPAKREPRDGQP